MEDDLPGKCTSLFGGKQEEWVSFWKWASNINQSLGLLLQPPTFATEAARLAKQGMLFFGDAEEAKSLDPVAWHWAETLKSMAEEVVWGDEKKLYFDNMVDFLLISLPFPSSLKTKEAEWLAYYTYLTLAPFLITWGHAWAGLILKGSGTIGLPNAGALYYDQQSSLCMPLCKSFLRSEVEPCMQAFSFALPAVLSYRQSSTYCDKEESLHSSASVPRREEKLDGSFFLLSAGKTNL